MNTIRSELEGLLSMCHQRANDEPPGSAERRAFFAVAKEIRAKLMMLDPSPPVPSFPTPGQFYLVTALLVIVLVGVLARTLGT